MTNHFRLVEADDRFGERVVVRIAATADRRLDPGLDQSLGVADREILRPPVAMMDQRAVGLPVVQRLLQGVEREVGAQRRLARQPTMRREKTSITNATYTMPRHVATYVKSDDPQLIRPRRREIRAAPDPAADPPAASGIVVRTRRPRTTPRKPSSPHQPLDGAARHGDRLRAGAASRPSARRTRGDSPATPASISGRSARRAAPAPAAASDRARAPSARSRSTERSAARAQIGSTPYASRWASMNATITSRGGRAPPGQNTPTPCAGSHSRAAARCSPAPAPSPACCSSVVRPGRLPASRSAWRTHRRSVSGVAADLRRRSTRSPPTATRAPPAAPAPAGRPVPGPPENTV